MHLVVSAVFMDVPEQAPPGPHSSLTTKRRYREMCHQCRHDKQRCEPQDRDWEKQEKCGRCIKMEYACGASERAPKKQKQKQKQNEPHAETFPNPHVSPTPQLQNHHKENDKHKALLHENSSAAKSQRPRPMTSFGVEASSAASTFEPQFGAHTGDMPADNHPGSDSVGAFGLLARLGNQIATITMLTLELEICAQVGRWLQDPHVGLGMIAAVQAGLVGVQKRFTSSMQNARDLAEQDLKISHEAFLLQVLLLQQRYDNLSSSACVHYPTHQHGSVVTTTADGKRIEHLLYRLQSRRGTGSDAEYLYSAVHRTLTGGPLKHAASSETELVASYSKAANAIASTMRDILFEDFPTRQTLTQPWPGSRLPFPTCILAARQSNSLALLELWYQSNNGVETRSGVWEKDIFGRTPVHVAAYTGNLQALELIFEAACVPTTKSKHSTPENMISTAVVGIDADTLGMTPLMITACRDDLEGFQLLLNYGASIQDFHNGRTVLSLARQNASQKIVQYIASSELVAFPASPVLANRQEAIGHLQRLDRVLDVVQSSPYSFPPHVASHQSFNPITGHPSIDCSGSQDDLSTSMPYLEQDRSLFGPASILSEQLGSSTSWLSGQYSSSSDDFG